MNQTSTHIFVSYAHEDVDFVRRLANCLTAKGLTVWWDFSLIVGSPFRDEIASKIDTARAVIVVWSKHSISSNFVLDEASRALKLNKLVPLSIAETFPPLGFGQLQTLWINRLDGDVDRIVAAINQSSVPEMSSRVRYSRLRAVRFGLPGAALVVCGVGALPYVDHFRMDSVINCFKFGCDLNYVTYRSKSIGVEFVYPMKQLNLDTTKEHLGRLPMFNQIGQTEVEIFVASAPAQREPLKASADEQNKLLATGHTITYTAPQIDPTRKNWYVIAGIGPDGIRYYIRRWYFDERIVSIEFHYRPELKPLYDKIIPDMTLKGIKIYDSERS